MFLASPTQEGVRQPQEGWGASERPSWQPHLYVHLSMLLTFSLSHHVHLSSSTSFLLSHPTVSPIILSYLAYIVMAYSHLPFRVTSLSSRSSQLCFASSNTQAWSVLSPVFHLSQGIKEDGRYGKSSLLSFILPLSFLHIPLLQKNHDLVVEKN